MNHLIAVTCAAILFATVSPAHAKNQTVEDAIKRRDDLSVFYQALVDTGIVDELKDGEDYTIFAPTNEAFEKISKEKYPCFYSPECKLEVTAILRNHIVPGVVYADTAGKLRSGIYSLNNDRPLHLSEPNRNNHAIDGNAITYTSSFSSGIIYKIDGVIATREELSPLIRVSAATPAVAPAPLPDPAIPTNPTAASGLAPAGR